MLRTRQREITVLDQIIELTVLLNADMSQRLARDGLTVSRTHLLWTLRDLGPVTQRVLAEALGVSARTVTGLVDGLAETGFVTREPHPTDRRATLVTFTSRGSRVVKAMEREQEGFAHILFGGMSDRRFDGFSVGLGDVLARLKAAL